MVKNMNNNEYRLSVLIKIQLHKLNRYEDYQNGYKRIQNVRKAFNLSPRNWDDLLNASDNIPLGIYNRVYRYVRSLEPSEDLNKTQMDIAIDNLKKGLNNHEQIIVD